MKCPRLPRIWLFFDLVSPNTSFSEEVNFSSFAFHLSLSILDCYTYSLGNVTTENKESTFFFLGFSSWSSANVMAINAKIRKTLMPTTISNQLLENPTRKWSFKNATSQRTLQHLPTCAVLQRTHGCWLSRMSWFLHFTSDNIFMPNTLYIHFYNGRIQSKAWKFIRRGKKRNSIKRVDFESS